MLVFIQHTHHAPSYVIYFHQNININKNIQFKHNPIRNPSKHHTSSGSETIVNITRLFLCLRN